MSLKRETPTIKHHICQATGTHLCALDGGKCGSGCDLAENDGQEPFSSSTLNEAEMGALQAMCEMASDGRIQLSVLQARHIAKQTLKLIEQLHSEKV
mgnify:CR=1 FL=1